MLVSAFSILVAGRLGSGVSPDSAYYVSAARSFAESGRFTALDGRPLTMFPPGLPLILGTAAKAGLDIQATALGLNAASASVAVLLTYLLASRALSSRGYALAVAAAFSLSRFTAANYSMIWTEPLFTVSVMSTLLVLTRALHRRSIPWREVLLLGVVVSLATTLRFVGFALLPVVFGGVLSALRAQGWARALARAVSAAGLASMGFVYVVGRNLALGVGAFGEIYASSVSVFQVFKDTVSTLGLYAYPSAPLSPFAAFFVGVPVVALLLHGFVQALVRKVPALLLVSGFTGVYWVSLWCGQLAASIEPVNYRLVFPVFAPMLVVLAFSVEVLASSVSGARAGRRFRLVSAAVLVAFMLHVVSNVCGSLRLVRTYATVGVGLNAPTSRESPLSTALRDLPETGIASTEPALAYWVSGREIVFEIPHRDRFWPPERVRSRMVELKEAVDLRKLGFFVFFSHDEDALTPEDLEKVGIRLHRVGFFEDGSLYEVAGPFPAP